MLRFGLDIHVYFHSLLTVIPAKVGIHRQYEAWMIRFAHPFGAVLRTFSALRATSDLRRNDGEASDWFMVKLC